MCNVKRRVWMECVGDDGSKPSGSPMEECSPPVWVSTDSGPPRVTRQIAFDWQRLPQPLWLVVRVWQPTASARRGGAPGVEKLEGEGERTPHRSGIKELIPRVVQGASTNAFGPA